MKKTIFAAMMILLVLLSGCSKTKITFEEGKKAAANHENKWTILIYACGDNGGKTSRIIESLTKEKYPENINVAMQTGGSSEWEFGGINGDYAQRYLMQKGSVYLKDQKQGTSMGHYQTLTDFITWGMDSFPADNYMLFIVGDGNGLEVCYDELYDGDRLDVEEIYYSLSMAPDMIDAICFDAPHMASLELASSLPNYARYMVASEEKFDGFNYETLINCIKEYPMAQVQEVCRELCETYALESDTNGVGELAQLSLVDLSQITHLNQLFDALALKLDGATYALADTGALIRYLESSQRCTDSDMVDLASLAMAISDYCGESSYDVVDAVAGAVLYNVKGSLRNEMSGISVCYPKTNTVSDTYLKTTISDRYKQFLKKVLPDFAASDSHVIASAADTKAYKDYSQIPFSVTASTGEDVYSATINGDISILKKASVKRYFVQDGKILSCGETAELDCFWAEQRYELMLSSKIPTIKGSPIDARFVSRDSGYSIYCADILADGKKGLMYIAYSPADDKYTYIGIWNGNRFIREEDKAEITLVHTEKATGEKVLGKTFSADSSISLKTEKLSDYDIMVEFEAEDIYRRIYS